MPLSLTEEQDMQSRSAAEFLADRASIAQFRLWRERTNECAFDPELWREIVGMGWPGIAVSEAQGGAGLGLAGLGIVLEQLGRHLSVTPTGGWTAGQPRPAFDQQPIEVATLAECAITAWHMTGEREWLELLGMCADWFNGHNDIGVPMVDRTSGGGFDGLTPNGPNLNQGAESTIAAVTTRLHAQRLLTPSLG